MNKLPFLSLLLPAALFGQSGAPTITARVNGILSKGVVIGTPGVYLKQVNGPVLANQQEGFVFDPAQSAAVMALLTAFDAMKGISDFSLQGAVPRYANDPAGCPNPPNVSGTEPFGTTLREMMWRTDNARMHSVQNLLGRARIDAFSRALGYTTMTQPQIPGCQQAGRGTLLEFASVWERIMAGSLPAYDREHFMPLLPGKAQAAVESSDYEHIWDIEIPKMLREEAPASISQAQLAKYQSGMDLAYKSGVGIRCRQAECADVVEDRSIAGWFKIPYCVGGQTFSREFVFGAFISGAIDNFWTPGKKTPAELAFAAGKAELLREQIRDGVASCHGSEAVMVSPSPNSTFASRTVVFTWSAAANATGYRLDVGTTPGGTELITGFTTATNLVVTNLPCSGVPLYARLWTRIEQYGNPKDYTFRSCTNGGPLITSPTPGSALTSASVNFTWSAVTGADFYRLNVGSTLGGNDIAASTPSTNSLVVADMPTDGRIIFVRIDAHTAAGYTPASDFAYNNITSRTPAVSSIVNAVTQRANLSPGCLAVLSGANFGTDVTVSVAGIRAQVTAPVTGTQVSFLVPANLARGTYNAVIASGGSSSPAFPLTLSDSSPGIYEPLLDSSSAPVPAGRTFKPGDALAARVIGLGPLAADGRPSLPTRVTVGGVSAAVLSVGATANAGVMQIAFRVPSSLPSGAQRVVVIAGSESSNAAQLLIAGPAISGIVNGASFGGTRVAPGSLVSIFGSDLATEDRLGLFPQTLLPGSGIITINSVSAPLFDVVASSGQINLLVPFETPVTGSVPVVITNPLGTSTAFQLPMAPAAPGIFRLYDPSNPQRANAAALIANTAWRVIPASMAAAIDVPRDCRANNVPAAAICGEPAAAGDMIQLYVTGLGRATPNGNPVGNTLRTGDVAPANGNPLYRTVETPVVTIGGVEAPVAFSGVAPGFAGLYQVNVTVPAGAPAGDDVPVTIAIGGVSDTATVAIRR